MTGKITLPALIALGFGIYFLVQESRSTNGLLLTTLGAATFLAAGLARRWPFMLLFPFALGWYTFGVLGCLALGLAPSEGSGIRVVIAAFGWMFFGWYALSGAGKYRRYIREPLIYPKA